MCCTCAFVSYRCVRSMENAWELTAAVAKVWKAPSALEKAPPLVPQDVTPQGHRWRDTFNALLSFLSLRSWFTALGSISFSKPRRNNAHLALDYCCVLSVCVARSEDDLFLDNNLWHYTDVHPLTEQMRKKCKGDCVGMHDRFQGGAAYVLVWKW